MKTAFLLALAMLSLYLPRTAAAAEQTGDKVKISGTITDAAGKPVADALVKCFNGDRPGMSQDGQMSSQSVTTKDDGAFSFSTDAGSVILLATRKGAPPSWHTLWRANEDTSGITLSFSKPAEIRGRVVDQDGKPVADAEITVKVAYLEVELPSGGRSSSYLDPSTAPGLFKTTSARDGAFALANVPSGMHADLNVTFPGMTLKVPERDYISPDSMQASAGQTNLTLTLVPAGSVSGKMKADAPVRFEGIEVIAEPTRPRAGLGGVPRAPVQADGSFFLANLEPGSYRISPFFSTNTGFPWVARAITVEVAAGQTNSGADFVLVAGGLLKTTVKDKESGKPLGKVMVNVNSDTFRLARNTDANGEVTMRVPPGEFNVMAYKENARASESSIDVKSGETTKVELVLSGPPKITGKVTDPEGKPVADIELMIFPQWGSNQKVRTDADGKYTLSFNREQYGSSERVFYLFGRDLKRNLAAYEELPESSTTLDLKLAKARSLKGKVQDEDGKPIKDASITVYVWAGNSGNSLDKPVKTDAEGKYDANGLPPGARVGVNAAAKGYGSKMETIEEDSEEQEIEMPLISLRVANLPVAGKVVDSDGKPVARANVYTYGEGQPNLNGRTAEDGTFNLGLACEGNLQVSASGRDGYGNAQTEGGDTNIVITIGKSGFTAEERPRRASLNGKPLPDLSSTGISASQLPGDKRLLICLFDAEQRPSRRILRDVAASPAIKDSGAALIAIHVNPNAVEAFKQWKESAEKDLTLGCIENAKPDLKWATETASLPWFILTDAKHTVIAEGFAHDELETQLKSAK